jgi:hypothetical protein
MAQKTVHVVWKKPGEEPVPYEIEADEPAPLQQLVGGYYEAIRLDPATVLMVDEEGKIKPNREPNVIDPMGRIIVGSVVVCKHNRAGNQVDLSPEEASKWMDWLREHSVRYTSR